MEPLATGDWISGTLSPNGEWLALNLWVEEDEERMQVIEVASGKVVTDKKGGLNPSGVSNDGVVYAFSLLPHSGSRLRSVAPGASELESVFDDFSPVFSFWGPAVFLHPHRAAWLGTFGGAFQDKSAGVVVVGLTRQP